MSTIQVMVLDSPTENQIMQIVDMCIDAFETERGAIAMTGGVRECQIDLYRLSVLATALEGKLLVCQAPGSERILSVGKSFGPGKTFMGSEAQRALGWDDFWEKLPKETKKWWTEVQRPMSKEFIQETIGEQKYNDSWFITILATLPSERRKGYGSAIVKEVCKMAAKTKGISALNTTTSGNILFYESLGYKVIGSRDRPSPFGTFTNNLMMWEADKQG